MHNPAPDSPRNPHAQTVPAALRQALCEGAPAPRDARADCIAVASAVHQYLMAQRLLRAPA